MIVNMVYAILDGDPNFILRIWYKIYRTQTLLEGELNVRNEEVDEVSSYKTQNFEDEILVTLTIAGHRTTISIPVIEILSPSGTAEFLEKLVDEISPKVRNKIYALKIKVKGRR